MCKLQSPSKYSPSHAVHVLRCFLQCSSQFWTYWFWCLLVLLLFFVSPLPHQQHNSLWGLFSLRETSKGHLGGNLWIRRKGYGGHAVLGPKLLNTQCNVGRCARKSPILKWANSLKESSNKFTEANRILSQQCLLVHCYRLVPRILTQQGKPVLQGACPSEDNSEIFLCSPLVHLRHLPISVWIGMHRNIKWMLTISYYMWAIIYLNCF